MTALLLPIMPLNRRKTADKLSANINMYWKMPEKRTGLQVHFTESRLVAIVPIMPHVTLMALKSRPIGSVKNFVALVKNGSFLVRIIDMTILIEKEFIYGSSKRPNPTDYYRK